MPPSSATCCFTKSNGAPCGRPYRPTGVDGTTFTACANHRNSKTEFQACTGCGDLTRSRFTPTGLPMCIKRPCGLYFYKAQWKAQTRVTKARRAAEAEDAAARAAAAQALDDYVDELVESFDAAAIRPAPPPPPPAWGALSDAARGELFAWIRAVQAAEADARPSDSPGGHPMTVTMGVGATAVGSAVASC